MRNDLYTTHRLALPIPSPPPYDINSSLILLTTIYIPLRVGMRNDLYTTHLLALPIPSPPPYDINSSLILLTTISNPLKVGSANRLMMIVSSHILLTYTQLNNLHYPPPPPPLPHLRH